MNEHTLTWVFMVNLFWILAIVTAGILAIVTAARYINSTTIHLPKEKWECGQSMVVNEKETCTLYKVK